jgi:hypothetical protein
MRVLVLSRSEGEAVAVARAVLALGHVPTVDSREAEAVATTSEEQARWFETKSCKKMPVLRISVAGAIARW